MEKEQDTSRVEAHDGMTAASARNTGGGDEHTPDKDISDYKPDDNPGKEFNINDQAHSQSSKETFVKTVSNFHHEDGTTPPAALDSQHLTSPD